MELQNYLRKNGLNSLIEKYGIQAKRHNEFPNLVCLKYSQINSPMDELIVRQCRGIIVDEDNNWEIVSYPFDKFFNYNQRLASEIDWSTAKMTDKFDGALMIIYYYKGEWRVQTSRLPDACGLANYDELTFKEIFWDIWNKLGYRLPDESDQHYCFIFELVTKPTKVIVNYDSDKILLIGLRNLKTLEEEEPEIWASKYSWDTVGSNDIRSFEDTLEMAKQLNPMKKEGFVVRDANFNRIKVKSPQYVALHYLKNEFSVRRVIEIITANEEDEFLGYFPELRKPYELIKKKLSSYIHDAEQAYRTVKDIQDPKEFAQRVKHYPFKRLLFFMKKGRISSIKDEVYNMPSKKVEQILGIENIL